mmetsp:Transcript_14935/g.22474  ORF Transcript_14935/g.22474 Transcript_14935/m.22474 type:complete len:278 (-) Transcript_14935:138-971(-)
MLLPLDEVVLTLTAYPFASVIGLIILKAIYRKLFSLLPFPTPEHRDRVFFLLEHVFFSIWGYYTTLILPEQQQPGSSWLIYQILVWSRPILPSKEFHLFYLTKVATHTEDMIFMCATLMSSKDSSDSKRDTKMIAHHIASAVLCWASWLSSYTRIGSLVMVLHDVSDIPLDLVRIFGLFKWKGMQIASMLVTLGTWAYWRLWYFPFVVLYTIAVESKSLHFESACVPGNCTWEECVYERMIFLVLLGVLQILHVIWYVMMIQKSVAELTGKGKKKKS